MVVKYLCTYNPGSRCHSGILASGKLSAPAADPCHMCAVPTVVVRIFFPVLKITESKDPALQIRMHADTGI